MSSFVNVPWIPNKMISRMLNGTIMSHPFSIGQRNSISFLNVVLGK
jgi:hypothetical protein